MQDMVVPISWNYFAFRDIVVFTDKGIFSPLICHSYLQRTVLLGVMACDL